jgi:hypothetical protein
MAPGARVLKRAERGAQGLVNGLRAGGLGGAGPARGAEQGADRVVHGGVVPAACDLAAAGCLQAGIAQGGFEVAWPREGIGCVIAARSDGMSAVMASCATVPWDRSGAANRLATPHGHVTG